MEQNQILDYLPPKLGVLLTDPEFNVLFSKGIAKEFVGEGEVIGEKLTSLKMALQRGFFIYDSKEREESILLYGNRVLNGPGTEQCLFWLWEQTKEAETERKFHYVSEILDNISEGVIATDRDGRIVIYNRQLAEFEDLQKEEVLGKRLMDVYEWSMESSEHMRVLKTGVPIKEGSYKTITRFGRINHLIATTLPVVEDGQAVAAYSISRNVTKIRDVYNRTVDLQQVEAAHPGQLKNGTRFTLEDIIHNSSQMRKLVINAQKAALGPSPVMIWGETGTGKELVVQGIHNAGPAREEPFVALNCAALPESLLESLLFGTVKGAFTGAENMTGYVEQARHGTLYLDEINSMSPALQAKLLRVLQEKTYRRIGGTEELPLNCKITSSVNRDPLLCIQEGLLRQDLYYRLSTILLYVPALREREEDVPRLIDYFLKRYTQIYGNKEISIAPELYQVLASYNWPGNVRELEHLIEQAVSLSDENEELTIYNLPSYLRKKLYAREYTNKSSENYNELHKILWEVEKSVITDALQKNGGNITRAAKSIGIGRQNLQYRIDKLGIQNIMKGENK